MHYSLDENLMTRLESNDPSIKDIRIKSRKTDPLLACPNWLNPLYPCGHNKNFEKSDVFCTKMCRRPHLKNPPFPKNVRTGQTPLSADVFYRQPLKFIGFDNQERNLIFAKTDFQVLKLKLSSFSILFINYIA